MLPIMCHSASSGARSGYGARNAGYGSGSGLHSRIVNFKGETTEDSLYMKRIKILVCNKKNSYFFEFSTLHIKDWKQTENHGPKLKPWFTKYNKQTNYFLKTRINKFY